MFLSALLASLFSSKASTKAAPKPRRTSLRLETLEGREVPAVADIVMSPLTLSSNVVPKGGEFSVTWSVKNNGPDVAENVISEDGSFSVTNFTLKGHSPNVCESYLYDSNGVAWLKPKTVAQRLLPGQTFTATATFVAVGECQTRIAGYAGSWTDDPNRENNWASPVAIVVADPQVTPGVQMVPVQSVVNAGGMISFSLSVWNMGSSILERAKAYVHMPQLQSPIFFDPRLSTFLATLQNGAVQIDFPSIRPNEIVNVIVTFRTSIAQPSVKAAFTTVVIAPTAPFGAPIQTTMVKIVGKPNPGVMLHGSARRL